MSTKVKVDFKELASKLMFNFPSFVSFIKHSGVKFRKGKGVDDINNASIKARKNGMGKVEYELDMLELYLKDVFLSTYTPQSR